MMISSRAALLYLSLSIPAPLLVTLFIIYRGWALLVVLRIFWFKLGLDITTVRSYSRSFLFIYSIVYLATPLSLVLFYKFFIAWGMLSVSGLILVVWIVNSIAEQW